MSTKRVNSFIFRSILPVAVVCLAAAAVVSCGHKHSSSGAPPAVGAHSYAPAPGGSRTAPTIPLSDVLEQIDAYHPPSGLDAARFSDLKSELKRLLQARSKEGKTISSAPTGTYNSVDDLAAMSNQEGTKANVVWTEKLKGDYNNDGVVNIADLGPVVLYYGQWENGSDGPERLIDGDGSPFIDIGDLAAIAANYGSHIEGYQVWRGYWNGTSVDWDAAMRPNPNAANPTWSADRSAVPPTNARPPYGYMDDITGVADKANVRYRVVPYGDGAAGAESKTATMLGSGLAASSWPKIHGDIRNSGLSSSIGPQTNAMKWNYQTGMPIRSSPAIGADGTVFVTGDNQLFAINGDDGTLKWKSNPGPGLLVLSEPAVSVDGTIYLGCADAKLYAVDSQNGSVKWSLSLGGTILPPTVGPDGVVYVGAGEKICAVYPNGTLKWSYSAPGAFAGTPAIGSDGTLYAVCLKPSGTSYGFFALNSVDGTLKWQAPVSAYLVSFPAEASPVIAPDGSILVDGTYGWGLISLNPSNATMRWSGEGGNAGVTPAVGPDGTVYVTSGNTVKALDPATGELKWISMSSQGNFINRVSPVVGADGSIYLGDILGQVFALNPLDGSVKWRFRASASVWSSPSFSSDGSMYLSCQDGRIYAFGTAPTYSVSGVVSAPGGGGLEGVGVALTPGEMSATTLADGSYRINGVPNGSYTVMPTKGGYMFSPIYPSVTVSNADATQDFTAAPGGLAVAPWPKLHGTSGNTGLSQHVGAQTNNIRWKKDLGGTTSASPIVGPDGSLYVCAGSKGALYSLSSADGSVRWTFDAATPTDSPAIGIDGTVYLSTAGAAGDAVYALAQTDGSTIWQATLSDNPGPPAIGSDGTVLVEVGYITKSVRALHPADGSVRWTYSYLMGWPSCPAVGADGAIYVAGAYVVSVDKMGISKWSTMYGDSAHPDLALVSPSVGPSGDVYVKAVNNSSNVLSVYALNGSDGTVEWKFTAGAVGTLTSMSVPAVGPDGTVYFGSEDHYIYALNPADGSLKWKLLTGGKVLSSAAIGADNTVYIGSNDSNVYAINGSDGYVKWVYATSSWVKSSPAIGADGTVYVLTYNGTLYAFGP